NLAGKYQIDRGETLWFELLFGSAGAVAGAPIGGLFGEWHTVYPAPTPYVKGVSHGRDRLRQAVAHSGRRTAPFRSQAAAGDRRLAREGDPRVQTHRLRRAGPESRERRGPVPSAAPSRGQPLAPTVHVWRSEAAAGL